MTETKPDLGALKELGRPRCELCDRTTLLTEIEGLTKERDNLARDLRDCEARLRGMRTSRDHWQRVAGKHSHGVQLLKGQLKAERELARMWPRYRDGAPVRVRDEVGFDGTASRVERIDFGENGYTLRTDNGSMYRHYGAEVDRLPILAADGEPIEVGETLFGEDGKAWTVETFDRTRKYSVWAHDANNPEKHKCLKPEWLTHERPTTLRDVIADIAINCVQIDRYTEGGVPVLAVDMGTLRDLLEEREGEIREKLEGGA